MPDERFYPRAGVLSAATITQLTRGKLLRGDAALEAATPASPDMAGPDALVFVANRRGLAAMAEGCDDFICLTTGALAPDIPGARAAVIAVADARAAFGLVLREMFPFSVTDMPGEPGIHPSASIAGGAIIGRNVRVEAGAVIEADADIGEGCIIGHGAHIGRGCVLGRGVCIGQHSVVSHALIGDDTIIGRLCNIGSPGFGIGRDAGGANYVMPHLGRVIIGKGCAIAGHCAIDRGFIGDTVIGDGVMIDNLVHIGHNCHIGSGTVICGQTGFAGSVQCGRDNVFGAQAGVADHIRIGNGNIFAARSGVTKNIGDGAVMAGFPAVAATEYRKQIAATRRLAKKKGETK